MTNVPIHNLATSDVLACSPQVVNLQQAPEDEAVAGEGDEPPDNQQPPARLSDNQFKRNIVRKATEPSESLLTKALLQPEEELADTRTRAAPSRRRSVNSNISFTSTADLTSDTGLTSPARTNTPSPPPPVVSFSHLHVGDFGEHPKHTLLDPTKRIAIPATHFATPAVSDPMLKDSAVEVLAKKRCISFACGPNFEAKKATSLSQVTETKPAVEEKLQRKPCIRFACPTKPSNRSTSSSRGGSSATPRTVESPTKIKPSSPSTLRKHRSSSANRSRPQRSLTPRPFAQASTPIRSAKFLTANTSDLNSESSHFHAFASEEPREEDWIRQNYATSSCRLTINDTLRKENEIRRLGKEAEEEALEEEEQDDFEADVDVDGNEADLEDDDDVEDNGADENVGDLDDGYDIDHDIDHDPNRDSDDADFDGYNTDNEVGFAESDADEDDGDLQLWTTGHGHVLRLSGDTPILRRPSMAGNRSDSTSSEDVSQDVIRLAKERSRRIKIRPGTPELPDSTDFVCGTLDEDRPLEDAYISCVAARRREKLHIIPQDIDPSFPTSEPEDEEVKPHKAANDNEEFPWIHGELEDLHHTGGERRRKKSDHTSPKRYHSPPPKRHHSPPPPPKNRGRSPRRLFDRNSPRRLVTPPPSGRAMQSPAASLIQDGSDPNLESQGLAFRPGLTHTKSLPRAPALFPQHFKGQRRSGRLANAAPQGHVRGAIDIVKGLEQKRQRRKEKFKEKYFQKHYNKARKGQVQERKPQPGQGAERMREIGLLIAGKRVQDQFVLSI